MEKYATYDYYKNKETGETKKVALHEENEDSSLTKESSQKVWIKITNENEIQKIENKN